MKIPFLSFNGMHSPLKDELTAAFARVLESNWFVMGKELEQFELAYTSFNQVNYTVGVSNGLDAIYLALKSIGVGPGDEVIVPSNTYIATLLAVSYLGAVPVLVEPDPHTYNMDPGKIGEAITVHTKAILPVHLYGQICDMESIMPIAEEMGLYVVEDNAQSHGAVQNGKMAGSFGHINATSFYPGKNLGALGDAGAITTSDAELAEKVKMLRNYGSTKKYYNDEIGHNMRMDELQAALLSVKLPHLDEWIQQRRAAAAIYDTGLANTGDLVLPYSVSPTSHVFHLYVIRTKKRDELQNRLSAAGIGTMIHYPVPPHLQQAYRHLGFAKGSFPLAEDLAATCLSLPLYPGMTEAEQHFVIQKIKEFF